MATAAIKLSRRMIKQYRDGEVGERSSLRQALQQMIADLQKNYSLQTTLKMNDDVSLASESLTDIIRVTGEALMNVVKHGKTDQATLNVTVDNNKVTVEIINHGQPWKKKQNLGNHYGIKNMTERAEKHNGKLKFQPLKKGLKVITTLIYIIKLGTTCVQFLLNGCGLFHLKSLTILNDKHC